MNRILVSLIAGLIAIPSFAADTKPATTVAAAPKADVAPATMKMEKNARKARKVKKAV